jgi:hypothetical protein
VLPPLSPLSAGDRGASVCLPAAQQGPAPHRGCACLLFTACSAFCLVLSSAFSWSLLSSALCAVQLSHVLAVSHRLLGSWSALHFIADCFAAPPPASLLHVSCLALWCLTCVSAPLPLLPLLACPAGMLLQTQFSPNYFSVSQVEQNFEGFATEFEGRLALAAPHCTPVLRRAAAPPGRGLLCCRPTASGTSPLGLRRVSLCCASCSPALMNDQHVSCNSRASFTLLFVHRYFAPRFPPPPPVSLCRCRPAARLELLLALQPYAGLRLQGSQRNSRAAASQLQLSWALVFAVNQGPRLRLLFLT